MWGVGGVRNEGRCMRLRLKREGTREGGREKRHNQQNNSSAFRTLSLARSLFFTTFKGHRGQCILVCLMICVLCQTDATFSTSFLYVPRRLERPRRLTLSTLRASPHSLPLACACRAGASLSTYSFTSLLFAFGSFPYAH